MNAIKKADDSRRASKDETRQQVGAPKGVAWWVGMIINPLVLPLPLLFLMARHAGAPTIELTRIMAVALIGYIIIPLSLLLWLRSIGRIDTIEARNREARQGPLFVGAGILCITAILLFVVSDAAKGPVVSAALVLTVNALLIAVITLRFKLSIHVASICGFISMLVMVNYLSGRLISGSAWILPVAIAGMFLVMWARIREDAHSLREVVAGWIFGLLLPALEFWLLHQGNLLYPSGTI